ncbi:MAG TPA: TetR/AcrR family transcriptional regulator [Mycobacteriales bacterium]|nr:TetR/AcrR family transcriptional regulator [Mycobacteriales bacterium]
MATEAGTRSRTATVAEPAPRVSTRRRGESLETAIYDAALEELARLGYSGLTMEGVAAAARTGKASLYRRWSHKDDLIVDALDSAMPHVGEPPDTGSVRDDLAALLAGTAEFVTSSVGRALQHSILTAERDAASDESAQATCAAIHDIKRRVISRRQELIYAVLRRGVERGEVRPGAVNRWVVDVGPALLLSYCLGQGQPVPDSEVNAVVDEVLVPLIRPVPPA